ncbi:MAG: DUF99 family protein [Thaumarchaeota archaeon]|nr:DUF99 family protein [Nitrososphaerota archaeon]
MEKSTSFRIKLTKKGIRALGIAESFHTDLANDRSILAGVVMRSDMIVDGFVFGSAIIHGDDSTSQIISMHQKLRRNDINLLMIGGAVISLFNIINIDEVGRSIGIPVISVTFKKSEGLDEPIKRHFPSGWEDKLKAYEKISNRDEVKLWTGHSVYVRYHGLQLDETKKTLDKFLKQGAVPEPIRLAQLLARASLHSTNG